MNLNKKFPKNSTKYTKANQQLMLRIVTSYSVFLLIILILFLFAFRSAKNNMRYSYNQNAKSSLMNNAELFEKDLNIMEVYCRQLLQNDDLRALLPKRADNPTLSSLGNAVSNSLAIDVYPESLLPIKEVFCYLRHSGYIINPTYFITSNRYYKWVKRYNETYYVKWVEALTNPDNYYQFLPMNDYTPKYENQYSMFLINMDDLYFMNADAIVCFVIDQKEIDAMFDCLNGDYTSSLFIVDTDQHILLQRGTFFEEDCISYDTVSSLHYNDEGFASFSAKSANGMQNVTVGKYVSAKNGLTYYYSFPAFESTGQIASRTFIYILIISLIALLGGWVIVLLSRKNMQPIIELGAKLQDARSVQNQLQKEVDGQKPIIYRSYIRQLLLGMVTTLDEVNYMKKYLHLDEDTSLYNGLYIVAYNNNQEQSDSISNDDFNLILLNAIKQYFGENTLYFRPADRTLGILLASNTEDEQRLILKTNENIVQLHNYLLETYGIWLFAGIGKNTDDLMNVWESYQQATEAASYISKDYFFFPYEFVKKDSKAFYYPPEISTKLIHFVTTGNTASVLELFNLIHQENIEERSLPVPILKFLLSDIRNTLLKARFALPETVSKEICDSIDERFNEHMTFKLCEDIALSLCEQFNTSTEDNSLISSIEKYIADNYQDASLGLNKIADEFQITETYFSHMFKEKTGVNFSTYLENIRMKEAARLIKETNISLNEIYINVGYNNINTFRRAFKKIYGVTPSNMRDDK